MDAQQELPPTMSVFGSPPRVGFALDADEADGVLLYDGQVNVPEKWREGKGNKEWETTLVILFGNLFFQKFCCVFANLLPFFFLLPRCRQPNLLCEDFCQTRCTSFG
jgi:hypothetical protein